MGSPDLVAEPGPGLRSETWGTPFWLSEGRSVATNEGDQRKHKRRRRSRLDGRSRSRLDGKF
jgi:hypothetical protein